MTEPILQFFKYDHLPEHLAEVSRPFGLLALQIVGELPENTERTKALDLLLAAKDAAVRARLFKVDETCSECGGRTVEDRIANTRKISHAAECSRRPPRGPVPGIAETGNHA